MDELDQRVHRRCGETIAAIMSTVDAAHLPRKQRQAIRRTVMAAVHSQGDDTAALVRGIDDGSSTFDEVWLTSVGFGVTAPDPAMHAALVAASEDDEHGEDQRPTG